MLGNFFKKGKKEEGNYLSLVITPDRILATIWTFENNLIKTLGYGHKTFENEDILIHQAAIAVDSAGEQAKVDITKTVFGISDHYLEDGSLSRQTTKMLKKLSAELELDPQAFVPISAGINHLLKIEESVTPHVVLIGVFGDFCEVHLLENGKAVQSKSSQSPVNIEKLKNLVGTLKEEERQLPARIVVYGISESTELAEKIAKGDWTDIFVHEPKIDFLDDTELSRSIAYAQAADVLGYDPQIHEKKPEADEPEQDELKEKPESAAKANELGFVEGEDILLSQDSSEKEDAKETTQAEPQHHQPKPSQEYAVEVESTPNVILPVPEKPKTGKKFSIPEFPNIFAIFRFNPASSSGKKIIVGLGILLLILIAGTFVFGQTIAKAEVVIKVNGKELEKNFNAKVVDGGNYNKDEKEIGGTTISGKASGSQKAVTTGSKKLGDPAKGEVTVYNWTNSPKSFSKGTGVISKKGIKFTLDGDIEVASRSATAPGEAKVGVAAQEVGPGGNLEAGQDFNFQEFDELSYSAINGAAFSGGAERQTTVVTQEDMDRLEKSLLETTTQKAKEDLKNKAQNEKLQDDAVVVKILNKQFDKKLDEEASLLNLNMEIEANAIVYPEEEMKKLLAEIFQPDAPQNMEIRTENISLEELETARDDDELNISGKLKAQMVPKFNEDELKDKIAGKSVKEARAKIKETPEVADVEVNFQPNLPIISSLPKNKSKIKFKIETS